MGCCLPRFVFFPFLLVALLLFSSQATADETDPVYSMSGLNITLVLTSDNRDVMTSAEKALYDRFLPIGPNLELNTSSASDMVGTNHIVLAIEDELLTAQDIADIRALGGDLILLGNAVQSINGVDGLSVSTYSGNPPGMAVVDNDTFARGYPINATINFWRDMPGMPTGAESVTPVSQIDAVGSYTSVLNHSNASGIYGISYAAYDDDGSSKVALIGGSLSGSSTPFHTVRLLQKAIYWQRNLWTRLSINQSSTSAVIVYRPQRGQQWDYTSAEDGLIDADGVSSATLTRIPVSELTFVDTSLSQRVFFVHHDLATTLLPQWRADGKDLFFTSDSIWDLTTVFGGSRRYNQSATTSNLCGDGGRERGERVVGILPDQIGYGYPKDAWVSVQNTQYRYTVDISPDNLTTIVESNMNNWTHQQWWSSLVVYSPVNSSNVTDGQSDILAFGFDPSVGFSTYHGNLLFDRAYDWFRGRLNISSRTAERIAIQQYGSTLSTDESSLTSRLQTRYGASDVSTVGLPYANVTNYSATELVVVPLPNRVTSLLSVWNASNTSILYAFEGAEDATSFWGGTVSTDKDITGSEYIEIVAANNSLGEPTMGYVPRGTGGLTGALIYDAAACRFLSNAGSYREIVGGGYRNGTFGNADIIYGGLGPLISYWNATNAKQLIYGFNYREADYHSQKLFDRSTDWLLGELNVTGPTLNHTAIVVTRESELDGGESLLQTRMDGLRETDAYNHSLVEVSLVTLANYSGTGLVLMESTIETAKYYDMYLHGGASVYYPLDGAVFAGPLNVFALGIATANMESFYNFAATDVLPLDTYGWVGWSNIQTQNQNHSYPSYGYPHYARIRVCDSLCYYGWVDAPTSFTELARADPYPLDISAQVYNWSVALVNNETFDETLAFFTFYPTSHHGEILFDRTVRFMLDDFSTADITKKTKDIVYVVDDNTSLTTTDDIIVDWLNDSYGDDRISILDVSSVMSAEIWGSSRFIAHQGQLLHPAINTRNTNSVIDYLYRNGFSQLFLGRSVDDLGGIASDEELSYWGPAVIAGVKNLSEYDSLGLPIQARIMNDTHPIVANLTLNTTATLNLTTSATLYTNFYTLESVNASWNFTSLLRHANCDPLNPEACPEVLAAVHEGPIVDGFVPRMALTGFYPHASVADLVVDWFRETVDWLAEDDVEAPRINELTVDPATYADSTVFAVTVNVTDNNCRAGRCLGVYSVTLNYTTDAANDSAWQQATLTRNTTVDDYWHGSLGAFPGETYVFFSVYAVDTSGNANTSRYYYLGATDATPPTITSVRHTPSYANDTDPVTFRWTTDEPADSRAYYQRNDTGTSLVWDNSTPRQIRINHTAENTTVLANGVYRYSVASCNLAYYSYAAAPGYVEGNCTHDTNGGDYYLVCIGPDCDRDAPNITEHAPRNGTIFPSNTTSITFWVATDEEATCRWTNVSDTDYADMPQGSFNTTGATNHSVTVEGLTMNATYDYYIRCIDRWSNANVEDYHLQYLITPPDEEDPVVALIDPDDDTLSRVNTVTFTYSAQDNYLLQRCTLSLTNLTGTNYSTTTTDNDPVNASHNNLTLEDIPDGTYEWTVTCWDGEGNSHTPTAWQITVNTKLPILILPTDGNDTTDCRDTDGKLCRPQDVAAAPSNELAQGFEGNLSDFHVVETNSRGIEMRSDYARTGSTSLRINLDQSYRRAYVDTALDDPLDTPYTVRFWMLVPSGYYTDNVTLLTVKPSNTSNDSALTVALDNVTGGAYALGVNNGATWESHVANISANTWTKIEAEALTADQWRLRVGGQQAGIYAIDSTVDQSLVRLGEDSTVKGRGLFFVDDYIVGDLAVSVIDTDHEYNSEPKGQVVTYDLDGEHIDSFAEDYVNESALEQPKGISTSIDSVVVANTGVNSDDVYLLSLHPNGTVQWTNDDEDTLRLVDVEVATDGRIYASHRDGDVISVYSENGGQVTDLSVPDPTGLFVTDEHLYVVSAVNDEVRRYHLNGTLNETYTDDFGFSACNTGGSDADLRVGDVAVDLEGRIYVVDTCNNSIHILNADGSHNVTFGRNLASGDGAGTNEGNFNTPQGADIDASGRLYVADSGNSRVQVFQIYAVDLDITAPAITIQSPAAGSLVSDATPAVCAVISDAEGSVASTSMTLDGPPVSGSWTDATTYCYTPPTNLTDGTHAVTVEAADDSGNTAQTAWGFTVCAVSNECHQFYAGWNLMAFASDP